MLACRVIHECRHCSHLRKARTTNGENAVTAIRKPSSSKFPRHEPKADLELAERALLEEMEHAAELLHYQEDYGRSGVLHAIHTCHLQSHSPQVAQKEGEAAIIWFEQVLAKRLSPTPPIDRVPSQQFTEVGPDDGPRGPE